MKDSTPPIASRGEARPNAFEDFIRNFRFRLASDEETKNRIFSLRYEVYCEELQYEDPAEDAQQVEKDKHDDNSLLCLIEHRSTAMAAGCMRLVNPSSTGQLPFQNYAGQSLIHPELHPERLSSDSVCEVSRLAISRTFRKSTRQDASTNTPQEDHTFSEQELRTFPLITIGLFLATYALVGLTERHHVFAMMELRLAKLLSRSGFNFTRVGETIDFHGKRSAFYINQQRAEEEMNSELTPLYRYVQQQLEPQLKAALSGKQTAALV